MKRHDMKDKLDLSIKDLTSAKGQIIGTWAMGCI